MTKRKTNAKRITAFLLCLIMTFSIFAIAPDFTEASTLPAPTQFLYDASRGEFSWLPAVLGDLNIRHEIQSGATVLWTSPDSIQRSVSLITLPGFASLQFDWGQRDLPTFMANVFTRTIAGDLFSPPSLPVTVNVRTDNNLVQVISNAGGTILSWTQQGIRPSGMLIRIYVNSTFSRTVPDTGSFDLSQLGLPGGQSYDISIRAVNPSTFSVSPFSNVAAYTPAAATFPVTVVGVGAGTTSASVASAPAGATVTLTAVPNTGASLLRWEVIQGGFTIDGSATTVSFIMPAAPVEVRAVFDTSGLPITVTRNENAWGSATSNVSAAMAGTTVELNATAVTGYRFVRWEVLSGNIVINNPDAASTTFVMPSTSVSIKAIFEPGFGVTSGYRNQVSVHHFQSAGNVTLELPHEKITEIINASTGSIAVFDITRLNNVQTIILPRTALDQFANANFSIEFRTRDGSVSFNRLAVSSVVVQATGTNVSVAMHIVARGSLSTVQQQALEYNDTVYNVRLTSLGQTISHIDGTVTVTIPYTGPLPVSVWRLFDNGTLETQVSSHHATNRTVTFTPTSPLTPFHFVVGSTRGADSPPQPPQPPAHPSVPNPFADVNAGQWFYDDVVFAYSNNLMGPTALNPMVFSPNLNLNRAMIVTILHRREGTPAPSSTVIPFNDVPAGQWFTTAIIWAAENNIVSGIGGGRFAPNANITRQDLAVILMRYADHIGVNFPTVTTYSPFADNHMIAGYARDAVRDAVEAGIIGGTTGNRFAPLENATRAQTAAMLRRFITAIA